jgi:hypothetical protein
MFKRNLNLRSPILFVSKTLITVYILYRNFHIYATSCESKAQTHLYILDHLKIVSEMAQGK